MLNHKEFIYGTLPLLSVTKNGRADFQLICSITKIKITVRIPKLKLEGYPLWDKRICFDFKIKHPFIQNNFFKKKIGENSHKNFINHKSCYLFTHIYDNFLQYF